MRIFILTLIVSTFLGCSDSEQYCSTLIETAGSADAQALMRDWVSENIYERRYTGDASNIRGAGGKWPGYAYVDANLDWSILNFKNEPLAPELRSPADIRFVEFPDDVSSIFFSERSRYGFLVRTSGSKDFGIDDQFIRWQDDDIAVICRGRD